MTWLDGAPILETAAAAVARRNEVALRMFRIWYVPFYHYGVIHGDPHLGNYTVAPNGGVNLLDFGCVRVFRASFVGGVIDLYHALERGDRDLAVSAYQRWGFGDLSREMIDVLNRWAAYVYGPLLDDRARRIQEKGSGDDGAAVVESVHRDIRRLGGVRPPREFVFMDRAAVGLGSVFLHLKAEINWHRLFHELIDDFDEAALAACQRAALEAAGVPLLSRARRPGLPEPTSPEGSQAAKTAGQSASGLSAELGSTTRRRGLACRGGGRGCRCGRTKTP